MMVILLLLIVAALALGIIGILAKTFFYLLIIGVIVLVVALALGALRFLRGGSRSRRSRV